MSPYFLMACNISDEKSTLILTFVLCAQYVFFLWEHLRFSLIISF